VILNDTTPNRKNRIFFFTASSEPISKPGATGMS
jgi:hypothetical protein